MAVVYVDSSFIDFLLYGFIASVVAVIVVAVAWGVREFRTPPESKAIRKASHKKKPMLLLAQDDGLLLMETVTRIGAEGSAETEEKKGKGKAKDHYTGFHSRPTDTPLVLIPDFDSTTQTQTDGNGKTDNGETITRKLATYISSLNTKHTFLSGAKISFSVGYRGKAILTTIAAIAGLQALEDMSTLYPEGFIKIDLTKIKHYFQNSWNEAMINAQEEDKFRQGYAEGKAKNPRDSKWWILPVLSLGFLFGMAALLIIVVKYV